MSIIAVRGRWGAKRKRGGDCASRDDRESTIAQDVRLPRAIHQGRYVTRDPFLKQINWPGARGVQS